MQTILGSGGAISNALANELKNYTAHVRLVARNPRRVNNDDELFPANLTDAVAVDHAIAGSEIVYLTVGLEYSLKVWSRDWPVIMGNVINSCLKHNASLVFFDNVYMYSASSIGHMTEASKCDPPSGKGKVRMLLQDMIFQAMEGRGLNALIARSADFYGPAVKSSAMDVMVVEKFKKNQKAFWQVNADKLHSFTYTPDAARATALLGNTTDAYGTVWHLPTSSEKLTGKDFIKKVADAMDVKPRYYILSKFMIGLVGLFIPLVKELKEMAYQYDRDYIFDSSKFERRFGIKPTSYDEGIKETVRA